jgi:hypothetical protein
MNPKIPARDKTPFLKFQALAKGLIRVPKAEVDNKIRDVRKQKSKNHENSN